MQGPMLLFLALATALNLTTVVGLPILSGRGEEMAVMAGIHLPSAAMSRAYSDEVSSANAKEVLGQ